ncbi:MAG TPA: hypothetical protein DCY79_23805 [Planctomycetaceae bacterium]|nr:hypothetical protein [Blastopirellula sp.]HAY82845.1 hypothetical protein [Planctomycetaceae bacterium]
MNQPDISAACIIGVRDIEGTEEVQACATLRADCDVPGEREILQLCIRDVRGYMLPKRIHFIADVPRKGLGKVDRERLRLRLEAGEHDL